MLSIVGAKKLHANTACHFDPLLNLNIGLFGQAGNAQRELDNLGVGEGDLFLFFGWFRDFYSVRKADYHHIFGWLQVDQVIKGTANIKNFVNFIKYYILMRAQMNTGLNITLFSYPIKKVC